MNLKLYKLTQTETTGCDTYDSCIVAATDEEAARLIHPYQQVFPNAKSEEIWEERFMNVWATHPKNVTVSLIGQCEAHITEPQVILASFNAG